MQKIGIIGAGYSGTALAANLHRLSPEPLEIILFEKRGAFAQGEAYSTPHVYHLLNIRAHDMSAFADLPNHFVEWLQRNALVDLPEHDVPLSQQFVPRVLYGKYLQDLLEELKSDTSGKTKLTLISSMVTDARLVDGKIALSCHAERSEESYQPILVDKVILALGNNVPSSFPFPVSDGVNCIANPWDFTAPAAISPQDPVLIVGTGLSMIDAVLTLYHQGHQGKIYALSRHGLLPLPHADHHLPVITIDSPPVGDLAELTGQIRSLSKDHIETGGDWRSVMNALRAHFHYLWEEASSKDKKRFLRHAAPYWNVHRHRVHNEIADLLAGLVAQQQLHILAGRVLRVENGQATIQLRHSKELTTLNIKWLINCMGPSLNMANAQQPLVQSLLQQGSVSLDALNLGFEVTAEGAIKEKSGKVSTQFFTLGPPTKGMKWETTAVPDIRKQCDALVRAIVHA